MPTSTHINRPNIFPVGTPHKPVAPVMTRLKDGTRVCLRPITPKDELRIGQGIEQLSPESRYLRFFSASRSVPDFVVEQLADVDGYHHIGWGAIRTDRLDVPAIGAAHAIRSTNNPETAELAVAVLDAYHGKGLGRMLLASVFIQCEQQDIRTINVDMIEGNRAALMLIAALGAYRNGGEAGVVHYRLEIAEALATMRANAGKFQLTDILGGKDN